MKSKSNAYAAVLVSLILCLPGCDKPAENAPEKSGYKLSSGEEFILSKLLENEQASFIDGGDTILFGRKMPYVQAVDIAKQYEANQVGADQQFFGKKLHVNGTVLSINSGIGNEPYVVLKGISQFLAPQVRFAEGNLERIASLEKGQRMSVLCEGGGAIVGVPIFKECIFAEDYAAVKTSEARIKINEFLSGEQMKSDAIPNITIASIAIARALPSNSPCFKEASKCNAEIEAVFNEKTAKNKLQAVASELKQAGVKIPSPASP